MTSLPKTTADRKRTWAIINTNGVLAFLEGEPQAQTYLNRLTVNNPRLAAEVRQALTQQQGHPRFPDVTQRLIAGARLYEVGAVGPGLALCTAQSYVNEVARVHGNAVVRCPGRSARYWCSCLDHHCGFHHQTFGTVHPDYGCPGAPTLPSGQILCADVAAYWLSLALIESD